MPAASATLTRIYKASRSVADGTGAKQNITSWALSFTMVPFVSGTASITKTTAAGGGITLTDPTNGVCSVAILDTDTDALSAGTYYYQLKRTDEGSETVLSYGTAVLKKVT